MRTRDNAAMLEAIMLAAQKVNTATNNVLKSKSNNEDIDDSLFQQAKDAHNEWCKAVDWYTANRKREAMQQV